MSLSAGRGADSLVVVFQSYVSATADALETVIDNLVAVVRARGCLCYAATSHCVR